ncbi:Golgi integral membrane protein 4 isoform X1 [Eubalaena glacialis]|uniref:Golgi integral membrane protein 4 isoform X1 n=1 Tax=Eubalaena glacialis TaxID=27606 RepID=UPI002A59D458|nr:Golgi integral membrane protein 4 isoform X1 [Eubalaena glacialis]
MGNGMCSRKQKRIFQTLLLLTVVFGFLYGAMLYYELQTQLRKAEAVALKYQQHQESLSAQLQVVYEHRSRLEKSLQKERLEHKKAKEDFLVYKLEAQETLNKGRQDSNSRYSALNVQHQMLKSQHEELKKQHSDLEEEHRKQGEDFSRTFNDHKQRYLQLQQEKEQELSKLKESVYNLREENRQLRRAHQDMHTQLQDVKQQHKNLLSEHEQLVVTLEDHKSALAAAQTQVAEYKQLKDTLNRIPSFRKPEQTEQQNVTQVAHSPQGVSARRDKLPGEPREVSRNSQVWQNREAVPGRTEETKPYPPTQKEAGSQAPAGLTRQEAGGGEPEERQVEEEHRRALEEEAMEQVGRAERLEEEHDPPPEEQRGREWTERREQKEARLPQGQARAEVYPSGRPVAKFPSPYEERLQQQRLAARRAEEAQRLKERQEALPQQRLQGPLPHQHRPLAGETAQQRQAGLAQGRPQRPEQTRQQARYDAVDNDIVQGAEDQGIQEEEGGAYERDNQHQDEAEEDPENGHELQEQGPHEADPESEADRAAVEDINPADDPNNQGEDEFEEAGQVREENLPDENEEQKQSHQKQENAEVEEHLVMAGNPDQQEDNVDDQYQEEGEEEVQEDLTEEKKRELEHNAEETYGENDENADEKNNDGEEQEVRDDNHPKGREDHYEEEEEEEEDGAAAAEKSRQRAEM